jgi:DNA-binding response OmpR family regulator
MRTILLADDNITVQRVIALTFAGDKTIQVVTVADGHQAMEKMAALRPDIVLAGTTLPQISGYDLAKFMRGKAELQRVPVLLLAGAFETVDEARLGSCGANGVLEKPVEPTLVINRVKELLGLKSDETPAPAGRLITPANVPAE